MLGLVRIWLTTEPDPELEPVTPPVVTPMVQVKVLGTDADKLIIGLAPLQIVEVAELVTAGEGFTVTVIVKGAPEHVPEVAVGVTRYWTVPVEELLGLVST